MSNFVISPAIGSDITFVPIIIDFDQHANRYWQTAPHVSQDVYKKMTHGGPGQDGRYLTRFGYDTTPLDGFVLWYVVSAADAAAALTAINSAFLADANAIANVANELTIPGYSSSFPNLENVTFVMVKDAHGRKVKDSGNGFWRASVVASFQQMRK